MNPQQPGNPNPSASQPVPPHPGNTQPMMPPGYMPPPGYPPQMQGYPQGYPPQMPGGYPMMPPGYMPPPGYPQGYPPQMPGYPQGYPMPPQGYPPMPGMMPPPTMPMPAVMPPPAPSTTAPLAPQPAAPPPPSAVAAPAAPKPAMPAPSAPTIAAAPVAAAPVAAMAAPADHAGDATHAGELFHPEATHHIEPAKPQNAFVRMWKAAGGGSLTLSIAIHAGILFALGLIVVAQQMAEKQVDFLPGGGTQQGAQASQDLQHKVQQKKRSSISKSVPMKKLVSNSVSADITLPEAPPDQLDIPEVSSMMGGGALGGGGFGTGGAGGGFGKGIGMGGANGFVSLPPSMRSRCSTQERLEKLRQNGGSPECEAAVSASLEWLKGKQNADGSWGRNNKCAMTGLALLCYLGRCETPESPFYGDNVMRGILFLIETQKKHPKKLFSQSTKGNAPVYEHGIAAYALGEMYTLARLGSKSLPGMREAFEEGVKIIIDNQQDSGSWVYDGETGFYAGKKSREDLSVAGWQFQALKAAKNTKLKIDGLETAIKKMVSYLEAKQTKDGGFGVANRDAHYNQWSLSGVGILGLQTMAHGNKTSEVKKGLKFLHEFLTSEPLDWNKNCNLYCWYYYTQAFFQAGGEEWKFYNQQFLPQILSAQQPDGSFKAGRPNWPAGDASDPIYRQALCTLQLEVFYRYLKVGDREEASFFDK